MGSYSLLWGLSLAIFVNFVIRSFRHKTHRERIENLILDRKEQSSVSEKEANTKVPL